NGASAGRGVRKRSERVRDRDVRWGRELATRVRIFRRVLVDENHMLWRPERSEPKPFGGRCNDPEELRFGGGADTDREEPDFHSLPPSATTIASNDWSQPQNRRAGHII